MRIDEHIMPAESHSYDAAVAALFAVNYGEAVRAARNLAASLRRTSRLFPLDGARLEALDEDARERLDAFRVRFADLQDLLAGKLFRGLLKLEEERVLSNLDVLNAMEKRGIIPSFAAWKRLRDIRNAFTHDYPEHPEDRAEALSLAFQGARELLDVLARLRDHALTQVGLPPTDLPEGP
jgi:hypothetical protein